MPERGMRFGRRFPHLINGRVPIPYELGTAGLLLWVGAVLQNSAVIRGRYPDTYWFWRVLEATGLDDLAPWYCLAAAQCLIISLFGHLFLKLPMWRLRAVGMGLAAAVFGFVAAGHVTVNWLSVAGAPFTFLAWRSAIIAVMYWRRSLDDDEGARTC